MARDGFLEHYVLGLHSSTKHNSTAYGYSVVAGATIAAVTKVDKAPSLLDVFMFIVGASAGFALINATATRGYQAEMPSEPPEVVALGTTFSMVSISAAAGAAIGVAYALSGWLAWVVASFAATLVYVLLVGLELGLAARAHPRGGRS
ncbi:MAG TPA: hypothetical protein VE982_01385 [Gaiellaceae bacterium]|nr:hypothetical protein [Gaiellaceae bacterium]